MQRDTCIIRSLRRNLNVDGHGVSEEEIHNASTQTDMIIRSAASVRVL
jgi:hypothetical protein